MVHFRRDSLGDSMLSQFEMADLRRLLENAGRGIAFPPETGEAAEEPLRRLLSDTGMKKMVSCLCLIAAAETLNLPPSCGLRPIMACSRLERSRQRAQSSSVRVRGPRRPLLQQARQR